MTYNEVTDKDRAIYADAKSENCQFCVDGEIHSVAEHEIRIAQSASGRATAAKLGPEGIAKRAKAGAAARWNVEQTVTLRTITEQGVDWAEEAILRRNGPREWLVTVVFRGIARYCESFRTRREAECYLSGLQAR